MVSFEEMIANQNLPDKFLAIVNLMGMDDFQTFVFKNTPKANWTNSIIFTCGAVVFWYVVFLVLHHVVLKPILTARKDKNYLAMTEKEK